MAKNDFLFEQNSSEFNFWPAFADLMLAVVFVLVLVLFGVAVSLMIGQVDVQQVHRDQGEVLRKFGTVDTLSNGTFLVHLEGLSNTEIQVSHDLTLQRITFEDRVLFAPDRYTLNPEGRRILLHVGQVIKEHINLIQEVQIQGHADNVPTTLHGSNVKLAALRAVEVFEFIQREVGIDPALHLMSATSFGEYRPVKRKIAEEYNRKKLQEDNATQSDRAHNRRIELLLFYKLK